MKPLRIVLIGCAALLLVIDLILSFAASSPVDAARASTVGKGWQQEQLSLLGFQTDSSLFGGTAHVNFNAKGLGDPKVIRVDLVRPVYSSNWRVSAYNEDMPKSQ
jgi:hypothetical protein